MILDGSLKLALGLLIPIVLFGVGAMAYAAYCEWERQREEAAHLAGRHQRRRNDRQMERTYQIVLERRAEEEKRLAEKYHSGRF